MKIELLGSKIEFLEMKKRREGGKRNLLLSEGLGPQSAQHGTVVGDLVVHLEVGTCQLIPLF
jgi:hypothetical protein